MSVPRAEKPMREPAGSSAKLAQPPLKVVSTVTGAVTPWRPSSPVTRAVFGPVSSTSVERNVICGKRAASSQSGRCRIA